jgi:uncharacterized membrane protein SpoIIM required for sporulation
MKVAQLLEKRRGNWHELERLCERLSAPAARFNYQDYTRFAALYRAVCADLALAESYQLPMNTVQYLHRLVGRAHNLLYRRRKFDVQRVLDMLFLDVPQRIFNDRCVQTAFVLFWGLFALSAALAYSQTAFPQFAEEVLTSSGIEELENNFKDSPNRSLEDNMVMAGFYIWNNTGIGLQCFSWGLLVIPGLFVLCSNALSLGAAFGYMSRPDVPAGANFFEFVTAHGPFELTAIVLSAGAGLKLGMSWIAPGRFRRADAMRLAGSQALPIMGAAVVMFFLAAMIEGFISPVPFIPFWLKGAVSAFSTMLLTFYFVVLGFPREPGGDHATG